MPDVEELITIKYKDLKITPEEVTDGTIFDETIGGHKAKRWSGKGFFDIFMNAFDKNIQVQFESGKITGKDYATAYVQLIQIAIDKAIQVCMANEELVLKAAELELKDKLAQQDKALKLLEQEVKRAQIHVLDRQTEGFATNLLLKLLESQQSNFAMMFASGMLDFDENSAAFPTSLKATELSKVYDKLFGEATKEWKKEKDVQYLVEERIERATPTSKIQL